MRPDESDELGLLIRREGTRHAAPPALAERIRDELRKAVDVRPAAPLPKARLRWLPSLALFGAGAATAWGLSLALLVGPAPDVFVDAVTDGHVRSLMADHLTDVASSDHHTVKPW